MDRNDIEDSAADAAGRLKETAGSFVDDAKGRAAEIARGTQDTYVQVRDRVADAASVVNELYSIPAADCAFGRRDFGMHARPSAGQTLIAFTFAGGDKSVACSRPTG